MRMNIVKIYEHDNIKDIFLVEKSNGIDIFYKDQKPFTGKLEIYGKNEKLELTGEIQGGMRSKKWIQYYPNGERETVEHYLFGKRNGRYEIFFKDGSLMLSGYFIDGKEDGLWTWYYPIGTMKEKSNYSKGIPQGWKFYYGDGKLKSEGIPIVNSDTKKINRYNRMGIKIYEGYFENMINVGNFIVYRDNGYLSRKGRYKNGKIDGQIENYYEGKINSISTYIEGKLQKEYFPNEKFTKYFDEKRNLIKIEYDIEKENLLRQNGIENISKIDRIEKKNIFSKVLVYLEIIKSNSKINKSKTEEFLRKIPESEKIDILNKIEQYLNINEIRQIKFDTGSVWTGKDVFLFFKEGMEL